LAVDPEVTANVGALVLCCELHANKATEALVKPCTLALLAGENISGLSAFRRVCGLTCSSIRLPHDPVEARGK
jgi:hypothetical protein